MIKIIRVEQALDFPEGILVDVRSEGEFAEGTIPNAINLCLLNDEERAKVGIEYKQAGSERAKRLGLELVSPRLGQMVHGFDQIAGKNKKIILFCWRGGMRSKFAAQLLDVMGFDVYLVEGGYKAYRRYVNAYFDEDFNQRAIVVHGLTGVGKTSVLKKLSQKGFPVLDLEGLAVHRGSVFGKVGLPPSPSQKVFESHIFSTLKRAEETGVFLMECESRRLGRLLIPTAVMTAMRKGYRILLYLPLADRVKRSLHEYTQGFNVEDNKNQLVEAAGTLAKYLGGKKAELLQELIADGQMDKAVELLLVQYYDPLYRCPDGPSPEFDLSVDTADTDIAAQKIIHFVTSLPEYNVPVNGGIHYGNR